MRLPYKWVEGYTIHWYKYVYKDISIQMIDKIDYEEVNLKNQLKVQNSRWIKKWKWRKENENYRDEKKANMKDWSANIINDKAR